MVCTNSQYSVVIHGIHATFIWLVEFDDCTVLHPQIVL
jgi:hypothetical protein